MDHLICESLKFWFLRWVWSKVDQKEMDLILQNQFYFSFWFFAGDIKLWNEVVEISNVEQISLPSFLSVHNRVEIYYTPPPPQLSILESDAFKIDIFLSKVTKNLFYLQRCDKVNMKYSFYLFINKIQSLTCKEKRSCWDLKNVKITSWPS